MARSIDTGQVTPADELRALLSTNEKRANDRTGPIPVAELLCDLDRIAELWPQLEAQGVDLRPESGRWDTLQAVVRRNARGIVRQARPAGGFPALRARHGRSEGAAWWWLLDQQVRDQDRRRIARAAAIAVAVLAVAVATAFVLRLLFPVDPRVRTAMTAMTAGERKVVQAGDFAGAAADFRRAIQATPDDPDPWVRLGAALQKVGDTAGAEAAFEQARSLLPSEVEWRVLRSAVYVGFSMLDEAEADLQVALKLDPKEPMVYFYQANIFEERRQYAQAVAALETAEALADEAGLTQLVVIVRYRIGMLMQQAPAQGIFPTAAPP